MEDKRYSVKEVAEILGLNPETIRRMIRNNEIFAFTIGKDRKRKTYRISREELHRFQLVGYKKNKNEET